MFTHNYTKKKTDCPVTEAKGFVKEGLISGLGHRKYKVDHLMPASKGTLKG